MISRFNAALAILLAAAMPSRAADRILDRAGVQTTLKDVGDGTYAETVAGPLPNLLRSGQIKIAVTSTAVCLTAAALANGVVVKALAGNAASIAIGGTGVSAVTDGTGGGYVLAAGEAVSLAVDNASRVCINGAAGAGVSYIGN